ncbi:MAG: sigma 54-interacting transcriptional regulator [Planctomycetes bacterium]|nr:sigma 54-interacting transcriptional regulator [Planctomycetota bacterium]
MPEKAVSLSRGAISEETLASLLEASAAINATLDLPVTLHAIARSAAEVLDAEASSVILLDKPRQKLVFKAAVGEAGGILVGEEFNVDLSIAGRVATSGEPMLVPDVRAHPDFFRGIDDMSSFTTREMLAAPLRYREEIIGVVEVLNHKGPGAFTERDLEILQVFANLAAISTSNAQMLEALKRENRGLRVVTQRDEPIIGSSMALREATELCERVAQTNATVLLLGETGTGKELSARAIHTRSLRAGRAFIAINCAALPETLLESELFGHEAGAFTGAVKQKLGRFELADGGTLFLDEIGDISPSTQIKLLRVLQEREFVRVGGIKTIACDVRIIAATNRDLTRAMEQAEFREDLYYRLNVFPIHLPPLRERREDIPLLVEHFVSLTSTELGRTRPEVAADTLAVLCTYHWPGNIREMRNVIERAVLLCDSGKITPQHMPREIAGEHEPVRPAEGESSLVGYEKAMILKALQENGWNQSQAARALGISRDNLRYRLRKYQIRRPDGE